MSTAFKKVLRKKQEQDKYEDIDSDEKEQQQALSKNDLPAEVSDNDSEMAIEDIPAEETVNHLT
jgi:hypothetical protein